MQHVNPYLIPNMRNAYAALGLSSSLAVVNNLYVRFLPSSPQQFGTLDSMMDAQGLDLFDAPMDYDILQEGDYYQDPSIPEEQASYQYAVVPPSFQFPSGISYTILAQIHIPDDNYTAIETEAERRAAVQDSLNSNVYAVQGIANPDNIECQAGYHYDPETRTCVRDNCQPGYHWSGTQCVSNCSAGYYWNGNTCVPIGVPPGPAPDAAIPAGNIAVSDVNLGTTPGVRNVRIVVKRWFKIQRLYADNSGHFQASKHFKHKVKIVVKFKNNYADIKGARGFRLWQMFLALSKTIGVYSGNKSNINYTFVQQPNNLHYYAKNKANQFWGAATLNNAVQEHRDYAGQMGFSPPPLGLKIITSGYQNHAGIGSTPLFGIRSDFQTITSDFASIVLYGGNTALPGGYANALAILGLLHWDMSINYATPSTLKFTDDLVKQTMYHELSHASQYVGEGKTLYTTFLNDELSAIHDYPSGQNSPYGTGGASYSGLIALGEAWAYHMGFYLCNQKYNVEPGSIKGDLAVAVQANQAYPGTDLVALENFTPTQFGDPFKWIPIGLMLDLIDNGEPIPNTRVNDAVSGFTIGQIFGALQSDVTSPQLYKTRLLTLYGTSQQSQIINLFSSYGY